MFSSFIPVLLAFVVFGYVCSVLSQEIVKNVSEMTNSVSSGIYNLN